MRIIILCTVLVLAPLVGFAAFDDATLTTDVVITAGGVDLSVSGSSAVIESITVDSDRFFFTLLSGSSIQITSSDKKVLSTNAQSQFIVTNECNSSSSVLKLSSTANGSFIFTVTPQSSTCGTSATTPTSSSSSSSSVGGGGIAPAGLIKPTPPTSPSQPPPPAKTVLAAPVAPAVIPTAPVFLRTLRSGTVGTDVKTLQRLLNKVGIIIAQSGDGSPGRETERFGALTEKAVQKFQMKYGIVSSGTPSTTGYGAFGAKTRAKLLELSVLVPATLIPAIAQPVASLPSPASGVSSVFTRSLSLGTRHADVKRLQQLLNTDPDTRITDSGSGSIGNETIYLGSLTIKAIQKFQVKYNVARPGDEGYGAFGPKTRARIQEVFGQ